MTANTSQSLPDMSAQAIEQYLYKILVEQFDVDPSKLSPEVNMFEDLGIDSIDAVDLLVYLKDFTGISIPPDKFRSVRTLGDVVSVVQALTK